MALRRQVPPILFPFSPRLHAALHRCRGCLSGVSNTGVDSRRLGRAIDRHCPFIPACIYRVHCAARSDSFFLLRVCLILAGRNSVTTAPPTAPPPPATEFSTSPVAIPANAPSAESPPHPSPTAR